MWTGKEGDYIPHCHIKVEDEHDICVRLDKAELFVHSNNDNTFHNNGEKKIFDNFMNKKRSDGRTNWEYAVDIWNKGNKIDIYFNTHAEALAWGVRYLPVELVKLGKFDAYKLSCQYKSDKVWVITWYIDGDDGLVHIIQVEGLDLTNDFFKIPESFSFTKIN